MVVADLHADNGLTVIDPHGSLVGDLLGWHSAAFPRS
jgi:hypothetical protein